MSASALGKPYDDSRDQPLPGMPADAPARSAAEPAAPSPASALAARLAAAGDTDVWHGMPEPGPEIELPAPTAPLAVGREIVRQARLSGALPYRYWRGDFYQHTGTNYEIVDKTIINKWLYHVTERAYYLRPNSKGGYDPKDWSPDQRKISNLRHALSDGLLTYDGEEDRCIALQNGVYNLKTDRVDAHSDRRFNLTVLPFAHDGAAGCPRWLQFLDEILPGDREAQDFLCEWFGYILSGRTDQHKMLALTGPKRCGKGTIARILEALLGSAGVASPTIGQLAGRFGEQSLIGKKLAVMSDIRWTSAAVAAAVEPLLAISGGDARDVERKNRDNWHGYLGVRFLMMSNDIPNFRDASGALAYRMQHIHFTQSFAGREDFGLTDALIEELPGIFNWALQGLKRFAQRGRLVPPASGEAVAAEVRRLASPYQAFLEDFCELDPEAVCAVPDLLRAYGQWARREGRSRDDQTTSSLSRGLRTTDERIIVEPKRHVLPNGQKVTMLRGVKLAVAPTWVAGDGAADHDLYERATLYEQGALDDR